MSDAQPEPIKHKRRIRYSGKNPRRFEEKYKERDPAKYAETVEKVLASGKTPAGTHRPIMVDEILEALVPRPGEIYLDATLGYGGHASAILPKILPEGKLMGLDVDPLELPKTEARLKTQFPADSIITHRTNFAAISKALAASQIPAVDMVLADLGVSSMQIDDPSRGFTFKADGPLDLRMNPSRGEPASTILSRISEEELTALLRENADEPYAERIANGIIAARTRPIHSTQQLAATIRTSLKRLPEDDQTNAIRRTFQALRIKVNDEFAVLESFLAQVPACLTPGGRIAILTFHSGEDRRVKHAFKEGLHAGLYDKISDELIRPTPREIFQNPRASSAKLRWAHRAE